MEGFVAPSMALGGAVKVAAEQCLDDVIKEAEDTRYANKMKHGKPTRMRLLGLLESRLYTLRGSAGGDRSKRIISWGEWFISGVDYAATVIYCVCSAGITTLGCSPAPRRSKSSAATAAGRRLRPRCSTWRSVTG